MTTRDEKQRRMALRRRLGFRAEPQVRPAPPRVGPPYLVAHACFSCRLSFKRRLREHEQPTCPSCGGRAYKMGRFFETPRRTNVRQWRKIQWLYAEGFRFWGSGSQGGAPLPRNLSDVEAFLRENSDHPLRGPERHPHLRP